MDYWSYNITLLIGVTTPFITIRSPPCSIYCMYLHVLLCSHAYLWHVVLLKRRVDRFFVSWSKLVFFHRSELVCKSKIIFCWTSVCWLISILVHAKDVLYISYKTTVPIGLSQSPKNRINCEDLYTENSLSAPFFTKGWGVSWRGV